MSQASSSANRTMVIHPGSLNLRIGRAWDPRPCVVPHVVAWRKKKSDVVEDVASLPPADGYRHGEDVNVDDVDKVTRPFLQGSLKALCGPESRMKVSKLNSTIEVVRFEVDTKDFAMRNESDAPKFLVADEALDISSTGNDPLDYDLIWPIRNGKLHVTAQRSLTAVLSDIETIWTETLRQKFEISKAQLHQYRCILVVADIYNRNHVKQLINMLLVHMNFSSVIIHQESVCATYGCGVSSAVVIDVGHQKTSVSCVDDGISLDLTRITFDFGGDDVTRMFHKLLLKSGFPKKSCDLRKTSDKLVMDDLKQKHCTLYPNGVKVERIDFSDTHKYHIFYTASEVIQAPLSFFYPSLHGVTPATFGVRYASVNQGDSEDPHDENYLLATKPKYSDASCKKTQKQHEKPLHDSAASAESRAAVKRLEEAIVWSISQCNDADREVKRRCVSSFLLVGGGLGNFTNVERVLASKLRDEVMLQYSSISRGGGGVDGCGDDEHDVDDEDHKTMKMLLSKDLYMRVVTRPKDLDPAMIVWKGASVMSCLDTAQELWIEQSEWKQHGLKVLRERCAFVW